MMEEYRIKFSSKSINDIKKITNYIRKSLKEPNIAEKYADLFINEIDKLKTFPKKHSIINEGKSKILNLRSLMVKNYMILYRVNESDKYVSIERVVFGASNWVQKI